MGARCPIFVMVLLAAPLASAGPVAASAIGPATPRVAEMPRASRDATPWIPGQFGFDLSADANAFAILHAGGLPGHPLSVALREDAADGSPSAASRVTPLPPPPGSLQLVLSGLACIAAYHGVRSLRSAPWHLVPEWYAADAEQVGYRTPADPTFVWAPVAAFIWDGIVAAPRPAARRFTRRDHWPPRRYSCFVPQAAPRGPPFRALVLTAPSYGR